MQRADKRKFHYIYKITRDDGRFYIGMHSTDNLDDGYFGSGNLITRSVKKHGISRHSKEIIEFVDSREELKSREKEIVCLETLDDIKCMNLKLGGEGGFSSAEHQFKAQSSGGKSCANRLVTDENFRREYSEKMSRSKQGHQTFLNHKHREETKEKMRKSKNQGEKNSQFGTCWVTEGIKPIKIHKQHLDEYLTKGFRRGRK